MRFVLLVEVCRRGYAEPVLCRIHGHDVAPTGRTQVGSRRQRGRVSRGCDRFLRALRNRWCAAVLGKIDRRRTLYLGSNLSSPRQFISWVSARDAAECFIRWTSELAHGNVTNFEGGLGQGDIRSPAAL